MTATKLRAAAAHPPTRHSRLSAAIRPHSRNAAHTVAVLPAGPAAIASISRFMSHWLDTLAAHRRQHRDQNDRMPDRMACDIMCQEAQLGRRRPAAPPAGSVSRPPGRPPLVRRLSVALQRRLLCLRTRQGAAARSRRPALWQTIVPTLFVAARRPRKKAAAADDPGRRGGAGRRRLFATFALQNPIVDSRERVGKSRPRRATGQLLLQQSE